MSEGILLVLLAMSVLYGWFTKDTALIQVNEEFVPMQFNTAISFLECGVALTLIKTLNSKYTIPLGVLSATLGSLTLCEYLTGLDLQIDELFFNHYITTNTYSPGMMSPGTALCFLLSGFAFMICRSNYTLFRALYLAVLVMSLAVSIGYLFGVHELYSFGIFTDMAVHTALGFLLVGVGLLRFDFLRIKKLGAM